MSHTIGLTVTRDGEVTLTRAVLDHLGARPGENVMVDLLPGGRVELRPAPKGSIDDFIGFLRRDGQEAVSIEEMNRVIAEGWAGKR